MADFLEHEGAQEPLQSGNVKNQQGNQGLSPRKGIPPVLARKHGAVRERRQRLSVLASAQRTGEEDINVCGVNT